MWAELYRVLGNALERLSRYGEALEAHERCLEAATESGDEVSEQAAALANLGY